MTTPSRLKVCSWPAASGGIAAALVSLLPLLFLLRALAVG
jgi:hypothetical protein